ncbi:MAG: hypothetical protein ACK46Q_05725 [Hyphomonas sp.]
MDRELTLKETVALAPAAPKNAPRAPLHLYLIGGAAFIWSLLAVFDFLAIITRYAPYVGQLPEMTQVFIYETPFWVWGLRAVAVFASLAGAVLLLRRRKVAVQVMALAATATILSIGFSFARPVPDDSMAVFGVCIVVVSVVLLHYAQTIARRGVLS